jgi:hypothetical protein
VSCSCSCRATERRRRPSAALVVATVALFLSLGGTSYAAVKAGSIGNRQLATDAVSASKIRANAVGASEITAGAVRTGELASGSVTGSRIALDAVTSQVILDGSIGSQDVADGSLGTQQVADGSLGTQDLTTDVVSRLLTPPVYLPDGGAASGQQISTSTTVAKSTEVRSHSVASPGAGTTWAHGLAAVRSASGAEVTCVLVRTRGADWTVLASSTVTVPQDGRAVVPVQVVTVVTTDDVVSLRCSTDTSAAVGPGSTLTLLRTGS